MMCAQQHMFVVADKLSQRIVTCLPCFVFQVITAVQLDLALSKTYAARLTLLCTKIAPLPCINADTMVNIYCL